MFNPQDQPSRNLKFYTSNAMVFTEVASKAQMALQLPHTFRPHKVIIMIILNKYFIMCLYFRNSNKFAWIIIICSWNLQMKILCSVHTSRSRHLGRSETLRERPDMCWANPETFSFLTSSHPLDSSTRYTTWRCYKLNSDDTRCFTAHKHPKANPPTSNTSYTFWVCRCEKVISGWWPPQSVEPLGCRYFVTIWSQFQWFTVSVLQSFNASQLQWLTVWMPHRDCSGADLVDLQPTQLWHCQQIASSLLLQFTSHILNYTNYIFLCGFDQVYRFPFLEMESLTYWNEDNRWIDSSSIPFQPSVSSGEEWFHTIYSFFRCDSISGQWVSEWVSQGVSHSFWISEIAIASAELASLLFFSSSIKKFPTTAISSLWRGVWKTSQSFLQTAWR